MFFEGQGGTSVLLFDCDMLRVGLNATSVVFPSFFFSFFLFFSELYYFNCIILRPDMRAEFERSSRSLEIEFKTLTVCQSISKDPSSCKFN